jgi:THO complex subunit 2
MPKDQSVRAKSIESRHEKSEDATKADGQQKKSIVSANGSDSQIPSSAQGKSSGTARVADEPSKPLSDEGSKIFAKSTSDSEVSPILLVDNLYLFNYSIFIILHLI